MIRTMAIGLMWCCWTALAVAQNQSISYDGFTEPSYNIMVAAIEIGRLDEVSVKVGDRVQKGDVIARLEDSLQTAAVKIARMQASMRGELDAAEAERDLQQLTVKNLQTLRGEAMTRPDELFRAETTLRIAEARLASAAEQDQSRWLELQRYELQLKRRLVHAPMSGVVADVLHQTGEYLTPGDAAVVRLIVIDTIYAVFSVPVEDIALIEPGATAAVYLRSNGETVSAKVESLSPEIDGESGTVRVRVALPNPDGKLRVGDRCTLRMIVSPNRSARIPEGARFNR